MNSTQLHYREATRLLDAAAMEDDRGTFDAARYYLAEAQVHATLGLIAALETLSRQADPHPAEAIAEAVGVYRPTPDNVIHHAFNAFGTNT